MASTTPATAPVAETKAASTSTTAGATPAPTTSTASTTTTTTAPTAAPHGTGQVEHVHSVDTFNALVSKPCLVLIDFFAEWCGPCKRIAPFLSKLAADNKDVQFIKVDVDEFKTVASQYKVTAMPTFKFLKGGVVLGEHIGGDSKGLAAAFAKYKAS